MLTQGKSWALVAVVPVLVLVACGEAATVEPTDDGEYRVSGEVIQRPGQPPRVAAEGVLLSDPPGGGIVALEGMAWDDIAFTEYSEGVRASEQPLTFYGDWDGESLRITSVQAASGEWSTKFSIERNPACSSDEALAPFYELDRHTLGILYWSELTDADGDCILKVRAIANSTALTQALASVAERTTVVPIVEQV